MKEFSARIDIDASAERVWEILVDVARWPEWNTTIKRVEGEAAPGEKIALYTTASPDRAFKLKVTEFDRPNRMVWSGGMPLGLFKGERTYAITPIDAGGVTFTMREVFSGLMAGMITKSIPDLNPSFDEFVACLKREAESA